MNAWRSPSGIFGNHSEDQFPHFPGNAFPAHHLPSLGNRSPVESESRSVPADNGFRGDDDERPLPLHPQSTDRNPEELVKQVKRWPRTTPFQDGQLLPQREVLKNEVSSPAKEAEEGS